MSRRDVIRHEKGLLHDGFFSFAVVWQMISYVVIINRNFEDFIKI